RYVSQERAAGRPIVAADFVSPAIPDEANGATVIYAAAAISAQLDRSDLPSITDLLDLASVRAVQTIAHHDLADRADALCLLRSVRDHAGTDWQIPLARPLVNTMFP